MATKVKPSRLQVSGTPQVGQVPVYVDEDTFQWGAGGGGGGASYTAGNGIDITSNEISIDESVVQTTDNLATDLTNPDDTHYPSTKAVKDAISSAGGGDVSGPNSSTDGDIVLFDGATGKLIKDSSKALSDLQNKLTAGRNIDLTSDIANLKLIEVTITTEYNTAAKIGTTTAGNYTPTVGDLLLVNFVNGCSVNNPTINIDGSGAKYIMVGGARASTVSFPCGTASGVNTKIIMYYDGTYYRSYGMFGGYSSMTEAEIQAGTATGNRVISPARLKYAIEYWDKDQVSDDAYSAAWDGETDLAPSQNAVYDKFQTVDTSISTIEGKIPSAATSSNQLADKNYVNDSINSVTAYYITKNAQGDQFATYAELAAATTFYSGGVVRVPTKNDYTIVLADENHDNATTRYIYNGGWEYQYTVNETALTQAQLDAINSGITAAKVTCYDNCYAQCCDIPTDNCQLSNGCGYTTCTGTLSATNAGTNGQVLTQTSSGPTWCDAASGGITNDTTGTTTTVAKIWAGTEAEYSCLGTKDECTIYYTF